MKVKTGDKSRIFSNTKQTQSKKKEKAYNDSIKNWGRTVMKEKLSKVVESDVSLWETRRRKKLGNRETRVKKIQIIKNIISLSVPLKKFCFQKTDRKGKFSTLFTTTTIFNEKPEKKVRGKLCVRFSNFPTSARLSQISLIRCEISEKKNIFGFSSFCVINFPQSCTKFNN